LPDVKTGKDAVKEYEAFKASQEDKAEGADERLEKRTWVRGKSSLYVDAFNLALDTVLDEESHLFDEAETEVFRIWRNLGYEAQYLYVRLFLRKISAWHRIKNLSYHSDISDLDAAAETLQRTYDLPASASKVESHPGELEAPAGTTLGTSFTFADRSEEEITTLEEASSLLKLDELKALAKDAKVKGKNKGELLKALRRTSSKQAGLGHVGLKRSDSEMSRASSASRSRPQTPDLELELEPEGDLSDDANRDAHTAIAGYIEAVRACPSRLLPLHRVDGKVTNDYHFGKNSSLELPRVHCLSIREYLRIALAVTRIRSFDTDAVPGR
jgi:Fanconi-associated nuclease 1